MNGSDSLMMDWKRFFVLRNAPRDALYARLMGDFAAFWRPVALRTLGGMVLWYHRLDADECKVELAFGSPRALSSRILPEARDDLDASMDDESIRYRIAKAHIAYVVGVIDTLQPVIADDFHLGCLLCAEGLCHQHEPCSWFTREWLERMAGEIPHLHGRARIAAMCDKRDQCRLLNAKLTWDKKDEEIDSLQEMIEKIDPAGTIGAMVSAGSTFAKVQGVAVPILALAAVNIAAPYGDDMRTQPLSPDFGNGGDTQGQLVLIPGPKPTTQSPKDTQPPLKPNGQNPGGARGQDKPAGGTAPATPSTPATAATPRSIDTGGRSSDETSGTTTRSTDPGSRSSTNEKDKPSVGDGGGRGGETSGKPTLTLRTVQLQDDNFSRIRKPCSVSTKGGTYTITDGGITGPFEDDKNQARARASAVLSIAVNKSECKQ